VYLWRAVDHEGEVLDVLVQRRRDKRAAVKLMRKLRKNQGFAPAAVVTDKLRSYGAAFAELGLAARHEQGVRMNNRAEVSHQCAVASARCSVSNQRDRLSTSSPSMPPPRHVQSPAPPHLPPHAAPLPCRGDGAVAGGNGGRLISMPRPAHCVFPQFP
jgi:hypothetical protein